MERVVGVPQALPRGHFPLGRREDVGSIGVCINTALLRPQPGEDPPHPARQDNPRKNVSREGSHGGRDGRVRDPGEIGETSQGQIYQNCCVRSSPGTRDLHCPLLPSHDSGRKMGWRAQGGCRLPSPKTSLPPIPL